MYLTLQQFKELAALPPQYIEAIEEIDEGWTERQLLRKSRWIDARLRKRYAVPFTLPAPDAVQDWLVRLVTLPLFLKRGVDPNDQQFEEYRSDAEKAEREVLEAANSDTGLFDLPLLAAQPGSPSAISRGGPFGYSEQSPYVAFDEQAEVGRTEDAQRGGSFV